MRIAVVIGVLLIVLGVVALGFQSITYFTTERAVSAGPFEIDVQKPHTIVLNPIVGVGALIAGALLVLAGRRSTIE
jgi:hypothetical protein